MLEMKPADEDGTGDALSASPEAASQNKPLRTARPTKSSQLWTLLRARFNLERKGGSGAVIFRILLPAVLTCLYSAGSIASTVPPQIEKNDSTPFSEFPSRFPLEPYSINNFLSSETYPPLGSQFDSGLNDENIRFTWPKNSSISRLFIGGAINFTVLDEISGIMISVLNVSAQDITLTNVSDIGLFESQCIGLLAENKILAGLFFLDRNEGFSSWKYNIFMNAAFAPDTQFEYQPVPVRVNPFFTSGFFAVQTLTEQAIYLYEAGINAVPAEQMLGQIRFGQELPLFAETKTVDWVSLWLPGFFLVLGTMSAIGSMLTSMLHEKSNNIIRQFHLVGVKFWLYWLHWWITFSCGTIITSLLLTGVWYGVKYVFYSSVGFVFIWIQLSMLGMVSFCLVVSAFTSNEDSAGIVAFLVTSFFGVTYIPVLALDAPALVGSLLTVLCPIYGMLYGAAIFTLYDIHGFNEGITSENIVQAGVPGLYAAQIVGLVIWTVLGIFFRRDAPKMIKSKPQNSRENSEKESSLGADLDRDDVVISIRGLKKVFKTSSGQVKAVDGVDMDICRNEVYGFLGHNGSGKTTTISMLSGECPPSAGDIIYNFSSSHMKLSEVDDISQINALIGVCPQENILFELFTCRENLELFARLKGNLRRENLEESEEECIRAEVERRMKDVNLSSKDDMDKKVKHFSGGMRRKVCIAMAMIGDPELLILDEATAGMDPYNRRIVWEMIAKAKIGRSILLTTHFMDEADLLSDRIGILNKGKIVACGTSLSLKHEFGAGYHLSFYLTDGKAVNQAYQTIRDIVPDSEFEKQEDVKHFFKVSFNESVFPQLLNKLEKIGCSDIVLQLTTLEEVFLRTGAEIITDEYHDEKDMKKKELFTIDQHGTHNEIESQVLNDIWEPQHSNPGKRARIWAMTKADIKTAFRLPGYLVFNAILPILYLIAGFVAGKVIPPPESQEFSIINSLLLDSKVITENIDNSVVFGVFDDDDGEEIYGIQHISSTPNFLIDSDLAGGFIRDSDTLSFNSTVEPVIAAVHSALTNSSLRNVTNKLNSGVEAIFSTVSVGPGQFEPSDEINLGNLFVPMFTNMGLLPLAYCLISIVAFSEEGKSATFRTMGVSKLELYLAVALKSYLIFFIPVFSFSVLFGLSLQSPVMGSGGRWLGFILLLLSYGFSLVPAALLFAPIFTTKQMAQDIFPPLWNMLNIFPFIVFFVLLSIPDLFDIGMTFGDAFSFLPPFAYQRAVSTLLFLTPILERIDDESIHWEVVWSWEARIWYSILMMVSVGTIAWVVLLYHISFKSAKKHSEPADKDVKSTVLTVSGLTKTFRSLPEEIYKSIMYRTRFFHPKYLIDRASASCRDPYRNSYKIATAVKDVTFELNHGENIVLVGPSGAGKTVLLKCITNEYKADEGAVWTLGKLEGEFDLDTLYSNGYLGYCPQFDAFFDQLSVEENIDIVTRLRGMGKYKYGTNPSVDKLVHILGLDHHLEKRSKKLSGGYKRKLSLVLALISSPELCILDEPTTGVDPGSRHAIWEVLKPKRGDTVQEINLPAMVISTHDMIEAEALASTLGIMINGELLAKGTVPELIEQHCTFFHIEATVQFDKTEVARDILLENFPLAILIDVIPGRIKMKVPHNVNEQKAKHLGDLFKNMEALKSSVDSPIIYYSVAQMSLEQIFIQLSNEKFSE